MYVNPSEYNGKYVYFPIHIGGKCPPFCAVDVGVSFFEG
jgi:hypothetical protein